MRPGAGTARHPIITGALALVVAGGVLGCAPPGDEGITLRFWAFGREGEVVAERVPEFERTHPGIRVVVQQMPWTAAHEKLLTAHVGRTTPDVAQLGNTWIPEFAALEALAPLDSFVDASPLVDSAAYFGGIWVTNRNEGRLLGVPWYVDTRVLFYRSDLLARAGYAAMPASWAEWRRAMEAVKARGGPGTFAIYLPTNEWNPPILLGVGAGSTLLADDWQHGAFREAPFRRAFDFYLGLYRDGLAPAMGANDVANLYQEFARGTFAMYLGGPWQLGEFARRLPPELQDKWATAPLPSEDGREPGRSLAGGSSLVVFAATKHRDAAWQLVEYLAQPAQQVAFFRLSGNLPARREAWADSALSGDPRVQAFRVQLDHVAPMPPIPEWELITSRVIEQAERAVRGGVPADAVLASLDGQVDQVLEKRRWLLARARVERP